MPDLVLIIDNYDSFVHNIAQIVAELGARPVVVRNDEITVGGIERMRPDKIIISPGPGSPTVKRDVGVSEDVVRLMSGKVPILGICLGHQLIGYVYGAKVRRARTVKHGKTSRIRHDEGNPLYTGIPEVFVAMRYHSLVIDEPPPVLVVDAVSLDDNEIMGIHHIEYPTFGVQFHPESIGTPLGDRIIKNFLDLV